MKPVNGGSPPKERMVNIIMIMLVGESWEAMFRCPRVDMLSRSKTKNIVVFIIK